MSILSGLIGVVVKPLVERRIRNKMCNAEHTRWNTLEQLEITDAEEMGGDRRVSSQKSRQIRGLHSVSDEGASE